MTLNRPKRRWLALSMRTMLVVILLIAVGLGWWVNSAHQQEAAVAAVVHPPYFANVWYDNEVWSPSAAPVVGNMAPPRAWQTWVPAFLESRLGKDYFHGVSSIAFSKLDSLDALADPELFRRIAGARSLEQLNPNVEVRDADVKHIAGLPNLKILCLRAASPGLSDEALRMLAGMPRLEMLEIHDAPITDAGLAHLKSARSLTSLLLGEAQPFATNGSTIALTGVGFTHLKDLPGLNVLEIHSPSLTADGLKQLGSLRHLERLRLKCAGIKDDDLRFLASLTELESLEIVGSNIDGTGFRHLVGLPKVSYVCLEGSNVSDASVPYLAKLPSLKSVMIYGTRVTAAGLEEFKVAPKLTQMGLIPAVAGDTKRLKQALPNCNVLNGGKSL